ncbi:MAG: hypothetical protein JWL70_1519 [Acidimicrobiia bacterium]|nr:hypothetical protein [Acidimicrobiia bacterium]
MARSSRLSEIASGDRPRWMVLLVAGAVAAVASTHVPRVGGDPAVYLDTVHRMRHGIGYYRAMDEAMRAVGIGPVQSTRAFRPPTAFLLWRWLPSDRWIWVAFLALTLAATKAVLPMVRHRWVALCFTAYLLVVGFDGYSTPELWSTALIATGIGLAWQRRTLPALAVLLVATSFRELAVLALIGVVIDGWNRPHVRAAAIGCGGALVGMYLLHSRGAAPFLVPVGQGKEARLIGSAHFPWSLLNMSGVWLPAGVLTGPLLLALALHRLRAVRRLWLLVPQFSLLLTGLLVHRVEWGMLVVPLTLTLGVDETWTLRRQSLNRHDEPPAGRLQTVEQISVSTPVTNS